MEKSNKYEVGVLFSRELLQYSGPDGCSKQLTGNSCLEPIHVGEIQKLMTKTRWSVFIVTQPLGCTNKLFHEEVFPLLLVRSFGVTIHKFLRLMCQFLWPRVSIRIAGHGSYVVALLNWPPVFKCVCHNSWLQTDIKRTLVNNLIWDMCTQSNILLKLFQSIQTRIVGSFALFSGTTSNWTLCH